MRLDPYELIARMCAMVPPPRFYMIRFHGVLAPNSALRERVVASAEPYKPPSENAAPNLLRLFAALALCRFDGLRDLGLVGAIGSVSGLVVVPAGLRLWGIGKSDS